mmetsp:Transcript_6050/g.6958  ORF Transcript_6050/g.6958 Transcript_6050/m.6958 type:complete len:262 (+) Transcript_6050:131-916(+)|eukprot:CAMPEP_0184013956 /NCGR_PEP_ID=MMETSP0954-20121128/5335_1 /TAXON_ID=627963 /ORGANISM="Aplanochytrium sp, Strain PBS07" /LENGTH=261 /DNA_ID=CAMNT_0026294271 /DNA_START=76 /DNA_END=861 /DNA_ORIENTATION=-
MSPRLKLDDEKKRESVRRASVWEELWEEMPFVQHHHHLLITSRPIVISASIIGWNALFMFVSEVIVEILILAKVIPKIPFRLDFFSLTTLSALLGYQTLVGTAKRELDVTRNSLILAFLVEGFLITGDIDFLIDNSDSVTVLAIRTPFVVLTTLNLILVTYMYRELHNTFLPDWPVIAKVLCVCFRKHRPHLRRRKKKKENSGEIAQESAEEEVDMVDEEELGAVNEVEPDPEDEDDDGDDTDAIDLEAQSGDNQPPNVSL